ncbi:MAG: ClbS/DfsB family four-helix bundle protein [Coriobacteriia bacterium]|nr:ClbS/DfsB family four-helix bundle protein [Coriobacteriia bacterium]
MPRPTNKADLILAADTQFDKLWQLVDSMTEEEQSAVMSFGADKKEAHWQRDKNLRDVLVHLYEWHQMVLRWYQEGTVEEGLPAVPGEGYTWATLPALNQAIWERYQHVLLADAKTMLHDSHAEVMALVAAHDDEQLFTKGYYKWTKSSNLGSYFISSTSSHYDWAMKKLKAFLKSYKAK